MTDVRSIVSDYRWLPHRLFADGSQIQFIRLERADHRAVTFLEEQYLAPDVERVVLPLAAVIEAAAAVPLSPTHFVFHSSLALSTLTTRLFDMPGVAMGLKEPIILNEIATLSRRGMRVRPLLSSVLRLLGRPFAPGEAVVVKPGNTANVLIPDILELRPDARALIMYAPLGDFINSVARKGMWARIVYRRLFALLRQDGFFDGGHSEEDIFEMTDLQIGAMAWLTHQAQFSQVIETAVGGRVRAIDADSFLANREVAVTALARFFGLDFDVQAVIDGPVFNQHSKQLGRAFDAGERERERAAAGAAYGEEIAMVVEWARGVAAHGGVPLDLGNRLI